MDDGDPDGDKDDSKLMNLNHHNKIEKSKNFKREDSGLMNLKHRIKNTDELQNLAYGDGDIKIGDSYFKARYVYGALEILGGIFLAFWGALLLDVTFSFILCFGCTVGLYAVVYNLNFVSGLKEQEL